jgi:hypothetical protein
MSIQVMKQALEALEHDNPAGRSATITALRQAIEQAEKQEGWVLREVYFSEGEPIGHREPQWVGLKDEDLPEGETYDFDRGVRWAERYLKEKNK